MGIPGITVFCSIVSWFQRLLFLFLLGKSSGVAFAPVAMASQGTGTSGFSSSAVASPSRTFRGGGDPTTLPRSAGNQSFHAAGGGVARRTKREERGCGGGGLVAAGPESGLGRPEVS